MQRMYKTPSRFNRQHGYTLVEISLGIIAALLLAMFVLGGFGVVRDKIKAYREVSDFPTVVECIKNRKVTQSTFAGTTTASVFSCFPTGMQSGANAVNYFNGTITVAAATTTTANDSLTFTSTNYSQNGCTNVGSGLSTEFDAVTVNGTQVKAVNAALNDGTLETSCVAGANTIVFLALK